MNRLPELSPRSRPASSFTSDSASAAVAPGPPTPERPARQRRVPFWDNARFACIVLVVLGHASQRLTYDSDAALTLYLLIYSFHMPAFAMISGYFSKSGQLTRRQMARVFTDIVLPYVIFESLWSLTTFLVEGNRDVNLTQPSWTLWFLLALALFRLVLPYLALLRWPLAWAVLISIGSGYAPNLDSTFSLNRTLALLPFFAFGWWLHEHDIVARFRLLDRRPWWVTTGALVLLGAAASALWFGIDIWQAMNLRTWLFYDESYADLGGTAWWAGGVRLGLMLVAVMLSAAFFALVPRRRTWWSSFGQYTMYVYLLHSFLLFPLRESGALRDLEPTWIWLPAIVLLSLAIALVLSTKPVRWVFRPLVEPRPAWLFAEPALVSKDDRRNDPTGSRRSHASGSRGRHEA